MENYLKKAEQQVVIWEREFETLLKQEIAKEPKWEAKRKELQKKIADARAQKDQQVDILRGGVEAAMKDLKATYDAMVEAKRKS